jgi:cytosine/adenosine deaminase-related metal-dependent hydrolase
MTGSLVIRGGTILTGSSVIPDCHVVIESGLISHVGSGPPPAQVRATETIDAREQLVIPGFVNERGHDN